MVDQEKRMNLIDQHKLDKADAKKTFTSHQEQLTKGAIQATENEDKLITLENYVERYMPM